MNTESDLAGFDPKDLRRAFGRFGTGVTVMTTAGPDGRMVGITANSFNTVSLEPPIVLWSLSLRSPNLNNFKRAGRFVVNVLAIDQVRLSDQFARPAEDKFAGVAYRLNEQGQPVLEGCVATLECVIIDARTVGDHELFLGQVERYAYEATSPLLYCGGAYAQAQALTRLDATN
ncbi:flavin reductase family protein [Pusillimonas sp. NJUB218]|uniref:flavin reductase family protein n=1 Tax=Pusillimonas sp. NJUB218 TaxID=2023230 RepID=UPI001F15E3A9|nr:flavin reductase family protein [Pusillimonas sp. NJUB218]